MFSRNKENHVRLWTINIERSKGKILQYWVVKKGDEQFWTMPSFRMLHCYIQSLITIFGEKTVKEKLFTSDTSLQSIYRKQLDKIGEETNEILAH